MLRKASSILLKHDGCFAFIMLISAALLLGSGATPSKATAAATALTQATKDIKDTAKSTPPAVPAPGAKININTAEKATLEKLPGIGPIKAQAIIDARPYKFIEDVMRVSGIKDKTFNAIKDFIVVR